MIAIYHYKKSGFSSFETIISITLISLFSLMIFPILKISRDIKKQLITQSNIDRKKGNSMNIIKNSIANISELPINYIGKRYIQHGIGLVNTTKTVEGTLKEDFFKTSSSKGNTLILEMAKTDGKNIVPHFLIFSFVYNNLEVSEGRLISNSIYIDKEKIDTFIKNITGNFELTSNGIFVNIYFSNEVYVKEYENFRKKYEK